MCPYEHAEPNGNLVIQSAKLLSITIVFIAGTLNLKKLGIFVITDEKEEQKKRNKMCSRKRDEGGRETEMEKANIFIVFSPVSLLINCTLLKKEFIAVCNDGLCDFDSQFKKVRSQDLRKPV